MGSTYIPKQNFTEQKAGSTNVTNPVLLLKINGVVYPNGYRITYAGGFRNFYPSYNSSNGDVNIVCHTIAYGEDLPEYSLAVGTAEVLVIG